MKIVATLAVALTAAALSTAPARAAIVTYDIVGTLSGSGLVGQRVVGWMQFDDAFNTAYPAFAPLLGLSFAFNGISVDKTSIFSALTYGSNGGLQAVVGLGRSSGGVFGPGVRCTAGVGNPNWFAQFDFASSYNQLYYWVPGQPVLSHDALTITLRTGSVPVPVPATFPLVAAAGLATLALRLRGSKPLLGGDADRRRGGRSMPKVLQKCFRFCV